ncbi:TIGR01777 family oxidoreductase [Sphingobacterium sp. UT-1RO-CII-1]|uniref:TIGR01777 family oxidoreductase n=1 Tax=Sphingobacterium sp. UT-1RO-CII-1 TaxID=2995225 RepID=UPI00227A709A|nr:TIGR01777 family oxidoreductase [Sphingobacterium sp. UT-1RO-CII-1]MCY4778463.1 TIGR01777 family oxidoreductase [Sphingobacterium sp. UT-1RO-CII-1]
MKKIILAGGTGNLGRLLTDSFLSAGYHVIVLTRQHIVSKKTQLTYVQWDGETLGDWCDYLEGGDVLINMCGESINTRFTENNRVKLKNSRYLPTLILGAALEKLTIAPSAWINFSGISIFEGAQELQDEGSLYQGESFLSQLVVEWERLFWERNLKNVRRVVLRLSPVLDETSGMFAELYSLAKKGLGGQVGDGKQYISWIHKHDLLRLVSFIIDNPTTNSVFHACSPHPVRNKEFMKVLRKQVGCKLGLPLPSFLAKIGAYIKGVDASLLLETNSVTTKTTVDAGFSFKYPHLDLALKQLILAVNKA